MRLTWRVAIAVIVGAAVAIFGYGAVTTTASSASSYAYDGGATNTLSEWIVVAPLHVAGARGPARRSVRTPTLGYLGDTHAVSTENLTGALASSKGYAYNGLGQRATVADGTSRYSYLNDPHGNVSLLLDQTSGVKASYGYTAYGTANAALTKTAASFNPSTNPYRYSGKRYDTGSNTLDMGARRYSPTTGRFLQQDIYYQALDNLGLASDPLTTNRYLFTGANPVNYVELDGHKFVDEGGGVGVGLSCGALGGPYQAFCWSQVDAPAQEKWGDLLYATGAAGIAKGVATSVVLVGAKNGAKPAAGVVAKGAAGLWCKLFCKKAAKDVPSRVARVVEERVGRRVESLGAPGVADVFVTSADEIAGMSAKQIAKRLSLYDKAGNLRSGPFSVFEFDTPAGIASPIRRTTRGFVGGGRTAGGASEYVVPNSRLDALRNLRRRTAR